MQIPSTDTPKLTFLRAGKIFHAHPGEIIRMEARSNYTCVYFTGHPPVLMAKVLRSYDELLRPYGFIRTHRSHLVNLLYVECLDQKGFILMKDDSSPGISRRKRRIFRKIFLNQ